MTTLTKDGQQINLNDFPLLYPNTTGVKFADEGWSVVFPTPAPPHDPLTQFTQETPPVLTVKGHWEQQWEVLDLDADTIAAKQAQHAQELQTAIVAAVQSRLDTFAQTRNYDGILSAATYASSTVPKFAAEGQCAVNLRDNTWATLYTLLAEIQAGTRPVPTGYADFEPLLPALAWPV